jgi:serine/threonine protein phosphatase 1
VTAPPLAVAAAPPPARLPGKAALPPISRTPALVAGVTVVAPAARTGSFPATEMSSPVVQAASAAHTIAARAANPMVANIDTSPDARKPAAVAESSWPNPVQESGTAKRGIFMVAAPSPVSRVVPVGSGQPTGRAVTATTDAVLAPPRSRSTEGRLVYAVGDIHGHLDLLEALLLEIIRDALAAGPAIKPMLIFVGDYVDRGLGSAGVIDLILAVRSRDVFEVRALKGNHEEALLRFLVDAEFGETWVQFGGAETLVSYGVEAPAEGADPGAWQAVRDRLLEVIPREHLEFFNTLELLVGVGDYAFAHAGINPASPLDRQVEHDLLWIRDEFLTSRRGTPTIVVHGHTPAPEPEILPHRLGIDTGAYATGVLTAVRLQDGSQSVIQVRTDAPGA